MDPFLRLPIEITELILSFLSTKEAIQKSILSKTFLQAFSTIPHLHFTFDVEDFLRLHPNEAIQKSASGFLNYVDLTLTRYQQQSIPITSFRLYTVVNDRIVNILEQCILKAQKHRLKVVCLDIFFYPYVTSSTSLLQAIFALEQLLVLKLSQCHLLMSVGIINCSSPLRILKLVNVRTDEWSLQKLFSFCPLVEELLIHESRGHENIQVTNLPNLKRLYVMPFCYQMVYVKAESLELIDYQAQRQELLDYQDFVLSPYHLTIDSTQNLKELSLTWSNIMEDQVHNLIAEFHALEKLILTSCNKIQKINVSSHSLSFIRLDCCDRLMEVNIVDAPNLNQFEIVGVLGIPFLSFPSEEEVSAGKRKSSVALHLFHLEEASSFLGLSELLMKLKPSDNILLYIKSREINFDSSTVDDLSMIKTTVLAVELPMLRPRVGGITLNRQSLKELL